MNPNHMTSPRSDPQKLKKKDKFQAKLKSVTAPMKINETSKNLFCLTHSHDSKENLSTFFESTMKKPSFKNVVGSKKDYQKFNKCEENDFQMIFKSLSVKDSNINTNSIENNKNRDSFKNNTELFQLNPFTEELLSEPDFFSKNEDKQIMQKEKRNYDEFIKINQDEIELDISYPDKYALDEVKKEILNTINDSMKWKGVYVKHKNNSDFSKPLKNPNQLYCKSIENEESTKNNKNQINQNVFKNTFLENLNKKDTLLKKYNSQIQKSKNDLLNHCSDFAPFCKFMKYFNMQITLEQKDYLNLQLSQKCKFICFIFTKFVNKKLMLSGFGHFWTSIPITILFNTYSKM